MYTQADLTCAQRRVQREVGIALALVAAGIAVAVTALVVRNRLMGYVGLTLCSVLAYARYALFASPWIKYRSFLADQFSGLTRTSYGWPVEVEATPRLSEDGVLVRGVTVRESQDSADLRLYYWDERNPFPEGAIGKKMQIMAYGRYIQDIASDGDAKNDLINYSSSH